MPQLSLYLNDAEMTALRQEAQAAHLTLSGYARKVLNERRHDLGWPEGFFELYGAIDEALDEPPELDFRLDVQRQWDAL